MLYILYSNIFSIPATIHFRAPFPACLSVSLSENPSFVKDKKGPDPGCPAHRTQLIMVIAF